MSPRAFVVTDNVQVGRVVEHHLTTVWSLAQCRVYSPKSSGRLHPSFTAAGYELAIVDERVDHGRGAQWLANLLHRPDFPPILYLLAKDDPQSVAQARAAGAVDAFRRNRIDHERFSTVARAAVERRTVQMQQFRNGPDYVRACRFGNVVIQGHRFVRELASNAEGSGTKVYLGESEVVGEMVVLKVLPLQEGESSKLAYARFLQEYETISRIRHPNVVRILDFGVADDHAYIAMEYFPKGDLRTRMNEPIAPRLALEWLGQMASALEAVHACGVLHRDLKPGNVMLRADGSVALIDFGIAKYNQAQTSLTAAGAIFGTPYYMSPEQGHGEPVDERSDLYSLGVIFYEMLMRRKPFLAPSPMGVIYLHRNAPMPTLSESLSALQPLVDRLLAKRPEDRFPSAAALAAEIETLRRSEAFA
jgi:tRNA A-37 threonylcarbamoyl transferase component Bud32